MKRILVVMAMVCLVGCGSGSSESQIYGTWAGENFPGLENVESYLDINADQYRLYDYEVGLDCLYLRYSAVLTSVTHSEIKGSNANGDFSFSYSVVDDRLTLGEGGFGYTRSNQILENMEPCPKADGKLTANIQFMDLPSATDFLADPYIRITLRFDVDHSSDVSEGDVFLVLRTGMPSVGERETVSVETLVFSPSLVAGGWVKRELEPLSFTVEGSTVKLDIPRSYHPFVADITNRTPINVTTAYNLSGDKSYHSEDRLPEIGYLPVLESSGALIDERGDVSVSSVEYVVDGSEMVLDVASVKFHVETQ